MFVKTGSLNNEVYDICFAKKMNRTTPMLISEWLEGHLSCKQIIMVTDSHVPEVHGQTMDNIRLYLMNTHEISIRYHVVAEGEGSKSLKEVERLWNYMAESCFSRGDLLLAFGGGMIGDLVGFCAATYLRGVAFIQVPTTLLSQIDSSVGGKVAINLSYGKNLVGQFYNPERVIIDVSYLSTLGDDVFQDGLGELMKYALMGEGTLISWLLEYKNISSIRTVLSKSPSELEHIVQRCLEIKRAVVEKDFKEVKERKYLNLGHTLGHAIEQAMNYKLGHGYCVVLGLWWIGDIGWKVCSERLMGECDRMMLERCEEGYKRFKALMCDLMNRYGFDLQLMVKPEELLPYLLQDKKRVKSDIQMILPRFDVWATFNGGFSDCDENVLVVLDRYLEIVQVPIERLESWLGELDL